MTELSNQLDLRAQAIREELVGVIHQRNDATPRHLQRELGISDISHPCKRKLAYGILEAEQCNPPYDPLPSIFGTALHSWLDSAFTHANNVLGRHRYLCETRVSPTDWLSGTSDLFDTDVGAVIDFKSLGKSSFNKNKKQLSEPYRRQIHIYGMGFERAGHEVKYVGALLLPRSGMLTQAHLALEPYDRSIAEQALKDRETVICLLNDLRVEEFPERLTLIEKSGPSCLFCPWFAPRPENPYQCEGIEDVW